MKKTSSSVATIIERSRGHESSIAERGEHVAASIKATSAEHLRNRSKHLRAHADGHGSKARQNPAMMNEAMEDE